METTKQHSMGATEHSMGTIKQNTVWGQSNRTQYGDNQTKHSMGTIEHSYRAPIQHHYYGIPTISSDQYIFR